MPRKTVSEKNTKGEIIDAYRELLNEVSRTSGVSDTQIIQEQAVFAEASKETVAKITTDFTQLKLSFNATIGDLTERLTTEAERLSTLQKAIAIAQKNLEETQQVKIRAGMLQKMIDLQKEKEEAFEKEMEAKQLAWELEQKEFDERTKRERTRSEEEYTYQKRLAVVRDEDEQGKAQRDFDREMAEKKEETARMIKELEDLRKRVGVFPTELEKATKEAVVKAVAEVKRDADVAAQLVKQQAESNLQLAQASITSLEDTVKSQRTEIARLNTELAGATSQVKEIAIAVAEGTKRIESPQPIKTS